MSGWDAFREELARWRAAGREARMWWRDDDAARPDPALTRLLELARRSGVPLALAVIPAQAEAAAFAQLPGGVSIIQHGSDHVNRAVAGEKKSEFASAQPAGASIARLLDARARLDAVTRGRALPVLAPPWNRLPDALLPRLKEAGFRGLSRYGARRAAQPAPGVAEVNTHADLIAWRAGRGFAGEDAVLGAAVAHLAARREGRADASEATGWLSHHAVHDEAAWSFLERLFETSREAPGARWMGAEELFHGA
jgi:hypothetical protein